MPTWAVFAVVVVLVVGYYLLSQQARERRKDRAAGDFGRIPDFYANQTYSDVRGEVAIGIDDRARRIAVARKRRDVRMYSFAHIVSVEVMQNDKVIATVSRSAEAEAGARPNAASGDGLFGSTGRPSLTGLPIIKPEPGTFTMAAVRVTFQNGSDDQVLVRFYDGKPMDVDGVVGERAFAEAQVFLGSLDIAMKRAGTPHRVAAVPKTPMV
jgi:hypothetical protein